MTPLKNVVTLITGTTVAQIIPFLISPILTRLYKPEEFGNFTLYMSFVSVFGVIATLRYDLAVVQPQDDADAKSIIILCLMINGVLTFLLLLGIALADLFYLYGITNIKIEWWTYFLPPTFMSLGIYNIFNYWLLRKKQYKEMSVSKVTQGASISVMQVLLSSIKSNGLIIGQLFGYMLLALITTFQSKKTLTNWQGVTKRRIKKNAKDYKEMPLFSTGGALIDSLSQQLPNFVITKLFGTYVTGMFGLMTRMLSVPSAFITMAVSQVVYREAIQAVDIGNNQFRNFVLKILLGLLILILPFAFLLFFCGEKLFIYFFGESWAMAGKMASIVAVPLVVKFSVSPLSIVLAIKRNMWLGLTWQIAYFFSSIIIFWWFKDKDILTFMWIYSINEIVLYIIYLILIFMGIQRLRG